MSELIQEIEVRRARRALSEKKSGNLNPRSFVIMLGSLALLISALTKARYQAVNYVYNCFSGI